MRLSFDPTDPFPLLVEDVYSYADAQEHSAACDAWLGLETELVEQQIRARLATRASVSDQQLWTGLPVKSLLTPYTEIREILRRLNPQVGQAVVDFGAGYGRFAFVIGRHYPGVKFIGYEVVPERVEEANRVLHMRGLQFAEMKIADLADTKLTPTAADFYFTYDFGTRAAIEKTLQDLKCVALGRAIVVVGRGRASRDAIERDHPWLSQVVAPQHFPHYSIYRSAT